MKDAPDVLCDRDDYSYGFMYDVGMIFITIVFILLVAVVQIISDGYKWQYGNRIRDDIPWTVACMEVPSFAMKGYERSIRRNVDLRIVTV